MDPLSISASVAGLYTLADLAFRWLIKYTKEVKDAPKTLSRLATEVRLLCTTLHGVSLLVEELEPKGRNTIIQSDQVQGCQAALTKIEDKIKKLDSEDLGRTKRITKRLAIPFATAEIEASLEQMQRFTSIFSAALQAESIPILVELLDGQEATISDLKVIKNELFQRRDVEIRIALNETREKVLRYFRVVNTTENHEMSLKLRYHGTGLWLLEDNVYQEWRDGLTPNVWLYGIPGAGKTVLAATIVQDALQQCANDEAVAYFYCDYKDLASQDPVNILGSIAVQLAVQHEKCFDLLREYYEDLHPKDQHPIKPDRDQLISIIKNATQFYGLTSIIIDGLNECGTNTLPVVNSLLSIGNDSEGNTRGCCAESGRARDSKTVVKS